MNRYALIKNGVVENIVVFDGEGNIFHDFIIVPLDGIECGPGWQYLDGKFVAPDSESVLPD
ncbi:hypothetical protein LNR08_003770 [Escherichia coli]|uniref:hypothetical protein n=1 Tax=Enterobacteriaceae TaxID=543 RepID=UPI0017E98E09|nr:MULTISPECIES: hypothetical protein [Enterobacteriaceae]EFH5328786.1 hypothetical protein [Escherichia coli]EIM5968507.1 hypothetical protein [Escherichia coli]EJZ1805539.1 hypothetical protein [Escherichia coli]EKK1029059.1 hypothetical protein [Escherichia coli]MDY7947608.1 hypothetical protein [Escherichia coli]